MLDGCSDRVLHPDARKWEMAKIFRFTDAGRWSNNTVRGSSVISCWMLDALVPDSGRCCAESY